MARTWNAYSTEQAEWVLDRYSDYCSYEEIARDFNAQFGTSKSMGAVQQFLTKKLNVYLSTERKATHYTKEEEQWLRDKYGWYETYDVLTQELNNQFGTSHAVSSVREKCTKRLGLKGMDNPTTFKQGNIKEQCPIGTIRKSSNGSTYIKVMNNELSFISGYREPYWLPLQKKIWMDQYGEVPEGKMVVFLDCNRENFDISNLYCIDRRVSAMLASNGWYTTDGELTKTAIKLCELHFALHGKKECVNGASAGSSKAFAGVVQEQYASTV